MRVAEDRTVFLVGFMGSGKSAAGRLLAERLSYDFQDTDARVEEACGRSIEQIFRESGEGRFRDLEWRVLQEVAGQRRLVVATGGGLFLGVVHRRFLKANGTTVWLDLPLEVIRERIGPGEGRPLWVSEDPEALRAFYEKRRAAYALADLRVRSRGESPQEVASRILLRLNALPH